MNKFKVYLKLTGIALVFVLVVIFMASNTAPVSVKFLGWRIWEVPTFGFVFVVASFGVLVYLVSRKVRKVVGEFRQLRREEKSRRELVDQVKKQVAKTEDSTN